MRSSWPQSPGLGGDVMFGHPHETLARRNRTAYYSAGRTYCLPEQPLDAARHNDLEVAWRAHLRFARRAPLRLTVGLEFGTQLDPRHAGRVLQAPSLLFALEPLPLPSPLPPLFAFHGQTVAKGSDTESRHRATSPLPPITTRVCRRAARSRA